MGCAKVIFDAFCFTENHGTKKIEGQITQIRGPFQASGELDGRYKLSPSTSQRTSSTPSTTKSSPSPSASQPASQPTSPAASPASQAATQFAMFVNYKWKTYFQGFTLGYFDCTWCSAQNIFGVDAGIIKFLYTYGL